MNPPLSNGRTVGEDLMAERELKRLLEQDEKAILARYLNKADQVQATVCDLKKDVAGLKTVVDSLNQRVGTLETATKQSVADIAQHRKQHHKATIKQDGWKAAIMANTKEIVITILLVINFALTGKILVS